MQLLSVELLIYHSNLGGSAKALRPHQLFFLSPRWLMRQGFGYEACSFIALRLFASFVASRSF